MNKNIVGFGFAGIFIVGAIVAYSILSDPHAVRSARESGIPSARAGGSASASPKAASVPHQAATTNADDVKTAIANLQTSGASNSDIELANAKAIDECRPIKNRPNYATEKVSQYEIAGAKHLDTVRWYASDLVKRCTNFVSSAVVSRAAEEEAYAKAAVAGSIEATARRLRNDVLLSTVGGDDPLTADDFKPQLMSLLETGDPNAIFQLSDVLGEGSKLEGPAAGNAKTAAAWVLVACDMGLDCTYGGSTLRQFCLNGGMYCGPGDLRQNMANSGFSPDDFSDITALERTIYAKVKSGNVSDLFH